MDTRRINPTPGRYMRLVRFENPIPGSSRTSRRSIPDIVREMQSLMLDRFRSTHPEAKQEPQGSTEERLDWYLRPRDAGGKIAG